jgi:hypothetical protein
MLLVCLLELVLLVLKAQKQKRSVIMQPPYANSFLALTSVARLSLLYRS